MRDFEMADIYLRDALRLFRRLGDDEGVAVALEALGNLALQSARFTEAVKALQGARSCYERLGQQDRVQIVDDLLRMANQVSGAMEKSGGKQ